VRKANGRTVPERGGVTGASAMPSDLGCFYMVGGRERKAKAREALGVTRATGGGWLDAPSARCVGAARKHIANLTNASLPLHLVASL
jgi:hypothetical protein